MTPEPFSAPDAVVYRGDCVEVMAQMPDCSIDAIVCDPPYGLEFMGKDWDRLSPVDRARMNGERRDHGTARVGAYERAGVRYSIDGRAAQDWHQRWATEALRVLKPGGHLAAFGGTRTFHRLTCGIEDAGFEIRDCLAWMYGSGFPKSLDVAKAIDRAAGAERDVIGEGKAGASSLGNQTRVDQGYRPTVLDGSSYTITAPATEEAQRWEGWGTALKPAWEPIILARRPLIGTVAANVLAHGTGALNIDGCRIEAEQYERTTPPKSRASTEEWRMKPGLGTVRPEGRWPANVVLDEIAADVLDAQTGELQSGKIEPHHIDRGKEAGTLGAFPGSTGRESYGDSGGASRFFYTAKASKADRGEGNSHPTVKPTDLMQWLVRLVTPPGGTVLDPFAGSGTTGVAAIIEGFHCVLIEREAEYVEIIRRRLTEGNIQPSLLGGVA